MGNICSKKSYKEVSKKDIPAHPTKIGLNFSHDEWKSYHNEGTIEQNIKGLKDIAIDLKKIESFPKCLIRAAFICCNTYSNPSNSLGVGPIKDAITVAKYMKEIGFNVYFLQDPRTAEYTKYFKSFLQKTSEYLVIYYSGHGSNVNDRNDDDIEVRGEAFIFEDNYLSTTNLIDEIIHSGKPPTSKLCLINDCCHSSPIYDFDLLTSNGKKIPQNLISFSTIRDTETSKATSVGGTDNGIFTFYFFKLLSQEESLTPEKMKSQINQYLSRFQQNFVIWTSTNSFLNEPIFK